MNSRPTVEKGRDADGILLCSTTRPTSAPAGDLRSRVVIDVAVRGRFRRLLVDGAMPKIPTNPTSSSTHS